MFYDLNDENAVFSITTTLINDTDIHVPAKTFNGGRYILTNIYITSNAHHSHINISPCIDY